MIWVLAPSAALLGSVPFSFIVAKIAAKTDLRQVGSGTVSGTALYRVAGFLPLVLGGILDVAKGAPGVLLASNNTTLMALTVGLVVAGHNWSPFINWQGGRGLSPAIGAFAVVAWPGALLILGGLAVGRLFRQTGAVVFVVILALPWVLLGTHGLQGFVAGWAAGVPMIAKRLLGNSLPKRVDQTTNSPVPTGQTKNQPRSPVPGLTVGRLLVGRLLFDSDRRQ